MTANIELAGATKFSDPPYYNDGKPLCVNYAITTHIYNLQCQKCGI